LTLEKNGSALSDVVSELGEGPSYDAVSNTLFWFDIVGKKLLAHSFERNTTTTHELGQMASAVAFIDDQRQLILTETGLHIRSVGTGKLSPHVAVEAENSATRSNDARVHPCGAFWFSTMGKNGEKAAGSIYWYFKGETRLLYPGITIPNSICFSVDGATAYYADTRENLLFRVDCDPKTGLPVGEPTVFFDQSGGEGGLDGSVIDADGMLWNARWGGSSIDAYSSEGKRIRSVTVPALQPSCPAFVGRDASRIAVTSAWAGMDEDARAADPLAGKTLILDLPVKGRLDPRILIG
jgi:sugar lactone lactonase YvrE